MCCAALLEAAEGRLEGQAGGRFIDLDYAVPDTVDEGERPAQVVVTTLAARPHPTALALKASIVHLAVGIPIHACGQRYYGRARP